MDGSSVSMVCPSITGMISPTSGCSHNSSGCQYEGIACRYGRRNVVWIFRGELEAPYDLKAVNYRKIAIDMEESPQQATAISIERKTSDHSFRKIATVGDNVTRYTDDSVH